MGYDFSTAANSLEEFWMPFTPQRMFKKNPRMVSKAEGMFYYDQEGNEILDAAAGLWCVNCGHNPPKIREAIEAQMDAVDYVPNFQFGNATAFKAASRLTAAMPEEYNHVFFSNSGSEAVDSAMKIALAYHRAKGEGTRRLFVGRERAYHGVGFGGISVGGLPYNRKVFGQLLPQIDHLPHTHNLEHNAFAKGEPEWGAHLADELENIIMLHDPSNVAAVIVEPVAGSTGVLPPPKGYLKRMEQICKKHGVLMIFDEVVTGFGRFGGITSSTYFDVKPDIITMAKGMTNGTIPMGATFVTDEIYDAFMQGPEHVIELMHGYTYSGHPIAAAACIGTMDTIQDEGMYENAAKMTPLLETAVHGLKDAPHVVDIRNCGLLAGIQLAEANDTPDDTARRAREASYELFKRGTMVRFNGTSLYISPPLIINEEQIGQIMDRIRDVLKDIK